MQSQTVTLIVAGIDTCGTLGGLVTGPFLTRSWQREQWLRDRRNEEFRELLEALSESYRIQLTLHAGAVLGPDEQMALVESESKTMAVVRSRIFTADVVRRCGIELHGPKQFVTTVELLRFALSPKRSGIVSAQIVQAAVEERAAKKPFAP